MWNPFPLAAYIFHFGLVGSLVLFRSRVCPACKGHQRYSPSGEDLGRSLTWFICRSRDRGNHGNLFLQNETMHASLIGVCRCNNSLKSWDTRRKRSSRHSYFESSRSFQIIGDNKQAISSTRQGPTVIMYHSSFVIDCAIAFPLLKFQE
jgi:hypothetical protein